VSLGTELKQRRGERKISLQTIQEETKISLRYLRAIESDEFGRLPGGVFNRGFLRSYCRVIGLDPEPILRRYESLYGPSEAPAQPESMAPPDPSTMPRSQRLLWAVGAATGAGLLAFMLLQPRAPAPAPAPKPIATAAATAPPAPAAPAGPFRIELALDAESWVEAHADGARLIYRIMRSGESVSIPAKREIRMTLGNPAAIRLRINGQRASWRRPLTDPIRNLIIARGNLSEFLLRPEETAEAAAPQPPAVQPWKPKTS
jgi:hypothetical protein